MISHIVAVAWFRSPSASSSATTTGACRRYGLTVVKGPWSQKAAHEEQLGVVDVPGGAAPTDVTQIPVPCAPHHGQVRQMACSPPLPGSSWPPSHRRSSRAPRLLYAPDSRFSGPVGAKECSRPRVLVQTLSHPRRGGVWGAAQADGQASARLKKRTRRTPLPNTASGFPDIRRSTSPPAKRGQYAGGP
jgi:hypothetical protein